MSHVQARADLLLRAAAPRQQEMSTIPVKNTLLHLNGRNLALAAKNSVHSRAPGPHLSPVPGKEAAGRLTASPQLTQEGTAQLDSLLQQSPKPAPDTTKNHPARRPLKLAPLVLPADIREPAPKPNLECSRDATKLKAKTCVHRDKTAKRELKKPLKPPVRGLEDVVCQGTPALLLPKLFPNPPHVKAKASTGPSLVNQDNGGERRLRLTRGQCLEEDEAKSKVLTTTAALSPCKDKRAKGVGGKGQLHRGNPQSAKSIREVPTVPLENKKSSGEDRKPRSVTGAAKSPRDGVSEGEKASPAGWKVKRKVALLTKHSKMVTLEPLQL